MSNRVVVTGVGVLSTLGDSKDEFWSNLIAGKSGISEIEGIKNIEEYPSRIGAELKEFNAEKYMTRKDRKRMALFTQYAIYTAMEALADADLEIGDEIANETGVIVGSGIGGLEVMEEQIKRLHDRGPGRISPFFIPMMISNMGSGQVSIYTGAKGPNNNTVTACASGTHAIGDAMEIIKRGDAKVMIAGGSEASITPSALAGFGSMKALSTRNDEPEKASRPFDKERDGFVIGEGSGMVVLEDLEHAKARGARIYGEVLGYGFTGDAHHITQPAPEGEGAARAMKMALDKAGIDYNEMGYINAHGTSTPFNDKFETMAIKSVFGEHADNLAISSTKSMTGHLLGAAGGVELIASLLSVYNKEVPPTINYENLDVDCDLDYVPGKSRKIEDLKYSMSNSFGFGGHNACLVVGEYTE